MPLRAGTAVVVGQNTAGSWRRLLSCIRLGEVLVLQGSPVFGALFAVGQLTVSRCLAIVLMTAGSTFLTAHVFVLNDWSGASYDLCDPNRQRGVFTSRGVPRNGIAYLAFALLLAGLLLLGAFGSSTQMIALAIAGASALNSFPGVHLKGVPVASSALHFLGGMLQFLLGYSIFTAPDWRSIEIGSFFALIFMAGHLTHETRDSASDRVNNIRTNAVTFGDKWSFIGGFTLFTTADVVLTLLALSAKVPGPLSAVLLIFPLHAYWSLKALRSGLTFTGIQQLQTQYRALYAMKGLWMAATLLFTR